MVNGKWGLDFVYVRQIDLRSRKVCSEYAVRAELIPANCYRLVIRLVGRMTNDQYEHCAVVSMVRQFDCRELARSMLTKPSFH